MTEYFPKPINSTYEFFEKLELEGKVKKLNSFEDFQRQKKLDELSEEARREWIIMNANSINSAEQTYVWN